MRCVKSWNHSSGDRMVCPLAEGTSLTPLTRPLTGTLAEIGIELAITGVEVEDGKMRRRVKVSRDTRRNGFDG